MAQTGSSLLGKGFRLKAGRVCVSSVVLLVVMAAMVLSVAVVPADAERSAPQAPSLGGPLAVGPLTMDTLAATFIPKYRETDYRIKVHGPVDGVIDITWTLQLELVDPAGARAPGEPGSAAAVDLNCNNAGDGSPNKPSKGTLNDTTHNVVTGRAQSSAFTWHHPDAAESVPVGKYHCNHLDMGPHGHQGLIKVVARDKNWECTATYKGTNSTSTDPLLSTIDPPSAADIERSLKNGTASKPKCSQRH